MILRLVVIPNYLVVVRRIELRPCQDLFSLDESYLIIQTHSQAVE